MPLERNPNPSDPRNVFCANGLTSEKPISSLWKKRASIIPISLRNQMRRDGYPNMSEVELDDGVKIPVRPKVVVLKPMH